MQESPSVWSDIGSRVRHARLALNLSQEDLGARVSLDRTMIAKIESGRRRLDGLELVRLASALKVSLDYLIQPVPEVISRRTALAQDASPADIASQAGRLDIALAEWLRDVRQLIGYDLLRPGPLTRPTLKVECREDARRLANMTRQRAGVGNGPIASFLDFCERFGQWVLVTELPGDGASLIDGEVAVAVVSLRGDPGRRRATAAHELGHLVIGDAYSSDTGVHASREEREEIVEAFAAELLLPTSALNEVASGCGGELTRPRLIECAARYRTSWSLAVRQAEAAGLIDAGTRRGWARSNPTRADFLDAVGWAPQPDLSRLRVPPRYAHAVMEAFRGNLVTARRALELMHGQLTLDELPTRDEVEIEP